MRKCKFDEVTSIYGRGGPGTTSPLIFEQPQAAATPLAPTPSVPAVEPGFVISPGLPPGSPSGPPGQPSTTYSIPGGPPITVPGAPSTLKSEPQPGDEESPAPSPEPTEAPADQDTDAGYGSDNSGDYGGDGW